MPLDRSFIEHNRASIGRIRELAARLTDAELQHPVGEHWTVAIGITGGDGCEERTLARTGAAP